MSISRGIVGGYRFILDIVSMHVDSDSASCVSCHSDHLQKNGQLPSGGQRYKCADCGDHFSIGGARGTYDTTFKEEIAKKYLHQHVDARTLAKKTGLSTSTIVQRGKKHRKDCKKCEAKN